MVIIFRIGSRKGLFSSKACCLTRRVLYLLTNMITQFIKFDWKLAQREGNNVALVFAALIDHHDYFKKTKQLKKGYFYNTKEMLGSKVNLKSNAIKKAEDKLEELGFIKTYHGKAKMKYYRIDFDAYKNAFKQDIDLGTPDSSSCLEQSINLETPKSSTKNALKHDGERLKAVPRAAQSSINHTKKPEQRTIPNNQNKVVGMLYNGSSGGMKSKVERFDEIFNEW